MPATEEWRPIPGFDGYFVSNLGRILSHKQRKPRVMGITKGAPYPTVMLCVENRRYTKRIHRLVAEVFLGDPPTEGDEVRHLNDDKQDNRVANLCWGSRSENLHDAVRNGVHYWAKREACRKGHLYSPENTLSWAKSGRVCRECHRERTRLYQAKRRAANRDAVNEAQRQWRAARKATSLRASVPSERAA